MVTAEETRDLNSIGWARTVRLKLIAEYHRLHPSPAKWDDIDRHYLEQLRLDIALLTDTERHLHRRLVRIQEASQ